VLYHITSRTEWTRAHAAGEYRPRQFAHEGFIHCSYAIQVQAVADRLFRATHGLVLLEIDPAKLSCRVIEENLEGGADGYPHVYGPLPLPAVVRVHDFPCRDDGAFEWPPAAATAAG
jgi:uncharacterized protein (DUF952 family)